MSTSSTSLQHAQALDEADTLAGKRDDFLLPPDTIYLNGNSLGPLTRRAQQRTLEVVESQWGEDLIASWNRHDWIDLPFTAAEKIAPLIGAAPNQVVCCDSVSINLLKLLACCLRMQSPRTRVLTQTDNFPTDLYVAQGLESLLGPARCELLAVAPDALPEALSEEVAVLLLTEINFRSAARFDMEELTALAHAQGVLVLWDLSHSAGVMPLEVDAWGIDFAVGCGYKYLNGGPGAPAFIYANCRHHGTMNSPVQGWMGHRDPFEFDTAYEKGAGMAQFLVGTPPILSLSALDAALDSFADVAVSDLHAKTMALGQLFAALMSQDEELSEFTLESNADAMLRGAHLAYSHPEAYSICRALNDAGIVVDFRSPNIVRFGFSPLYLRHVDVWRAIQSLRHLMREKTYLEDEFTRRLRVT